MRTEDTLQFHATFFDEAGEHLHTLEAKLLELEREPFDLERLNALFRAAHSIKSASAMLGFEVLAGLTHAMEGVLDRLRSQATAPTATEVATLLEATDLLAACLEAARSNTSPPEIAHAIARLGVDAPKPSSSSSLAVAPAKSRRYDIVFRPPLDIFLLGLDPFLCIRELLELGTGTVEALVDELPPLSALNPEHCALGWKLTLTTSAPKKRLEEAFAFVDAPRQLTIVELEDTPQPKSEPATGARQAAAEATLRVSTAKVDRLINLVGELVIAQAMVSRSLLHFSPEELPRLKEAALEMERHTRELQDGVMNIRMVPIGTIFNRFHRLTRDLSESLGKELILEVSGADTELDKSMVEALADPLTHLVRNAADHGLETAEARVAAGKSRRGTITLSARHQGGNVVVELADDGRGLDGERIRLKALERGLIREGQALRPDELHQLIFAPGFSTAGTVTDVSGRGVGMDVVKRSVEALNGSVSISTEPGKGTRFRLSLPLTLAILDGMSLRLGNSTFVLPLSQVVETLPFSSEAVRVLPGGAEVLQVRGQTLPLLRLSRLLNVRDEGVTNLRPLAVVCETTELTYAVTIDELLGKAQFVIKSLEANYRRLEGFLGATILGDGTVSFILDAQALASMGGLTTTADRLRRSA